MIREFGEKTTIHGFHYVTERKPMERIFWGCALIFSICFCAYLLNDLWASWNDHPISLTHDGALIDHKDIPTPAITICPLNKMSSNKSKLIYDNYVNFLRSRHNFSLSNEE